MPNRILLLTVLILAVSSRSYPMYKQCDPAWRNDQLGTSANTICSAGCLMSSVAMGLTATVKQFTPATLNKWLTQNGGYESGDLFVWESINTFGVTFQGKVANSEIKSKLDKGYLVMCNVHNGRHWVLATGYSGDNIFINDPNYTTPSYTLDEIVDKNNGVYSIKSGAYHNLLGKIKGLKKYGSNSWWKMSDKGQNEIALE